jgi:hypothetical protein
MKRILKCMIILLLCFLLLIPAVMDATRSKTPPIKDSKGQIIPESISSLEQVRLGWRESIYFDPWKEQIETNSFVFTWWSRNANDVFVTSVPKRFRR